MDRKKNLRGQGSASAQRSPSLPAGVRVREKLAPGIWQFEDDTGQLYLAVKAIAWSPPRGGDLGARW